MAACAHRPEEDSSFIACTSAFPEQKCVCGVEVLEDEAALVVVAADVTREESA